MDGLSTLVPGQVVGRYRIEAPLGEGGMGEVYRAHDTMLRRAVALKIVRVDRGNLAAAGVADPGQRARFLREARAVAGLRHPNVVTIFDVGEIDATPYLAMELLDGRTLRAFVGQPVALERKVRWLAEIASALAAAHRAGLVHRDIKPENVMVCGDDTVKILDFGVAKVAEPDGPLSAREHAQGAASFRTGFGALVGTPRYMAPEQAAGLTSDPRTDEFAWGLVAFELLTGLHPRDVRPGFSKEAEWREAAEPVERLCPGLPPPVAEAVGRALERFANARFPTMDAIVASLAPFVGPPAARGFEPTSPAQGPGPYPPNPAAGGGSTVPNPSVLGTHTMSSPSSAMHPPPKRAPWLALGFGAVVLLVLAAGGSAVYWTTRGGAAEMPSSAKDAGTAPVATTSAVTPPAPSSVPRTPSSAHSAPVKAGDAGVPADAGAKPHVKISLAAKVTLLRPGDYPVSVVEGALSSRIAGVERCLNDAAADVPPDSGTTINFTYQADGAVLASSVHVGKGMGACVKGDITAGLHLGPPKSGTPGGVMVIVYCH